METDPEMLELVVCKYCGHLEYYGMMTWHNGHTYCRRCILNIWSKHPFNYASYPVGILVFPEYDDGINYVENEPKYQHNLSYMYSIKKSI